MKKIRPERDPVLRSSIVYEPSYIHLYMVLPFTSPSHLKHNVDVDSSKVDPPFNIPTYLCGDKSWKIDFPYQNNASPVTIFSVKCPKDLRPGLWLQIKTAIPP